MLPMKKVKEKYSSFALETYTQLGYDNNETCGICKSAFIICFVGCSCGETDAVRARATDR